MAGDHLAIDVETSLKIMGRTVTMGQMMKKGVILDVYLDLETSSFAENLKTIQCIVQSVEI